MLDVDDFAVATHQSLENQNALPKLEAGAIRAHIEGAALVDVDHLFPPTAGGVAAGSSVLWHDAMRAFQRRLLQDSLAAHGGNVSEAAKALGIARSHAYELVRQLGGKKA